MKTAILLLLFPVTALSQNSILEVHTKDVTYYMCIKKNRVTNSKTKDTLYFKNNDKMFSYVSRKTLESIDFEKTKKIQDSIINRKNEKVKSKKHR